MKTPIADFVKNYVENGFSRFHMPGHKGISSLGCEPFDITEICGADNLSSASGIIFESEKNASQLFKTAHTFYTTGGSTAAICAMLALSGGKKILATRNVHKAFISACALLDYEPVWLMPEESSTILNCTISAKSVEKKILSLTEKPAAVYLTSPDYLGNIQDISGIAEVCRKYEIPLMVDNAHGAYLGFLEEPLHPIHLGATICCDSAHKTLPVLTGGAYLHISENAPTEYLKNAREKLSLFSSTSPSYLILQSLDLCNAYLADGFEKKLSDCIEKTNRIKSHIRSMGFSVCESEPLKITVDASASGFSGHALVQKLRDSKIEPEFSDNDYVVLMITPQNTNMDFERLANVFSKLSPAPPIHKNAFSIFQPKRCMSIREAVFSKAETVPASSATGRICAAPTVSCPPAVPIAVSGEEITQEIADLFIYYGIDKIRVVKK